MRLPLETQALNHDIDSFSWSNETNPHKTHKQGRQWGNIIPLLILYLNPRLSLLSSVPRNNGHNTVLGIDFDIELGNVADEAKDDPGKHNTFDKDNRRQPVSWQAAEPKWWQKSHIRYRQNEPDNQLLQCCCRGEGITVSRCVLIGLSPRGDTRRLFISV